MSNEETKTNPREVKIMIVPGKICRVILTDEGEDYTVLDVCHMAEQAMPDIEWLELAKSREVRVQNKKFSNKEEIPRGYFGSIHSTPLTDGNVILILTKITGNSKKDVGRGVITCTVNGVDHALESPQEVGEFLFEIGYWSIGIVYINGEEVDLNQLVGNDDVIVFEGKQESESSTAPTAIIGRVSEKLKAVQIYENETTIQDLVEQLGGLNLVSDEIAVYNGKKLLKDDLGSICVEDGDSVLIVKRRTKF